MAKIGSIHNTKRHRTAQHSNLSILPFISLGNNSFSKPSYHIQNFPTSLTVTNLLDLITELNTSTCVNEHFLPDCITSIDCAPVNDLITNMLCRLAGFSHPAHRFYACDSFLINITTIQRQPLFTLPSIPYYRHS
jgi:hypothetical protein